MTSSEILKEIERICHRPTMTPWARGFCDSIGDQIRNNRTLSVRQHEVIQKIFDENSDEAATALKAWNLEYERTWKKDAIILAKYYKRTGYYSDMAAVILRDEAPSQASFLKMLHNKYAKKVLGESKKTPKFALGAHVVGNAQCGHAQLRDNNSGLNDEPPSYKQYCNFKKRGGLVVIISDVIYSAAKGAKLYKILPIGGTRMFWVEERFMKKGRSTRKKVS